VDLGEGVAVSRVVIYNRNDIGCAFYVTSLLSNSVVSLLNYQGNTLKTYRIADAANVPVVDINFDSYLGCYADNFFYRRLLPHWAAENLNPNGRIQCSDLCKTAGYKLAGTQFSKECWCGNSLNGAQPVSNNDCNMKCLGNAAEMCGGQSRNSVYITEILQSAIGFSGPHFNKGMPYHTSGTYLYTSETLAKDACNARTDCNGVTQEAGRVDRYTLRQGLYLYHSHGEISWQKNTATGGLCDQLLQQFHRVDEELSIQGKWQGGSVTGVCRGWGTNKVRSIVHYSLGRHGRSLNEVHSYCSVPLYPVYIPPVNVSYCGHIYA
jgi:hypothetical protein